MAVLDIARTTVVTVPADATVASVVQTMQAKSVGSVVVVDADDAPIGLVSDRDLALIVLGGDDLDPDTTNVMDIVEGDLVTVPADMGIYDLVEVMSEQSVRRVPVVDGAELAGIVSLSDIVVLLGMELQHVANAIRAVSPAYEQLATELYD